MKKVLYLHGLESSQGGPKVEYLSSKAFVCAPELNYLDPKLEEKLISIVKCINPDLVIGSSMGGYVGMLLASKFNLDCIAFNPALHSRPIEPILSELDFIEPGYNFMPVVVLGSDDDITNPEMTLDMLEQCEFYSDIEEIDGVGHKVPYDVFIDIYNKYIK
jgi:predicted esterase YcpF (UPF0227 family)